MLLQPDAVVEFTVRDGVAAKIIGPAEFAIEYLGEYDGMPEYGINLLAGDYLEVSSLPDAVEIEAQVVIKTPSFHLEKVHTSDEFAVVISTVDGKQTVENSGGELVIKKLVKENSQKVFVSIKTNQTVQVDGDIALLTDEEAKEVAVQLQEQPLAIRYDIESPASGDGETIADVLLSTALQDSKIVMDTQMSADLSRYLDRSQLAYQVGQASVYYFAGNQASFDITFTNLLSKITRAYELLGIEVDSSLADTRSGTKSLAQGIILIDQLLAKMTETYYIEPAYTQRLTSLLNWALFLQQQTFGLYSDAGEFDLAQLEMWLQEQ
ncbi:MAG: hypothetical protein H6765_04620 [Candidatus Peribacteria bacterium]|nr:MAG: hypothetical protein H6765_04620 [Candidatus Peribacteria bacterium]